MSARSHRFPSRPSRGALVLLAVLGLCSAALGTGAEGPSAEYQKGRDSRLFRLDAAGKRIVGPASHVPAYLALPLASATVDQPQFWPDEKVHLRVLMPGRGGQTVKITWNKRDATPQERQATLDQEGAAVLVLADGKQERLQLGEYRADVASQDGKTKAHATFAVVEGTLGAVSLAFPFRQVTSVGQLDEVKAGWYLGSSTPGSRWGNGLSFKNELRVDNEPYSGEVEIVTRCMLSGCNGVPAGPAQRITVEKGKISGTLDVRGHSGPFQIELVTPQGSLRHQFEGSGHVERDMVAVSGGVTFTHKAGLAPYDGTEQVPGRQVFVHSAKSSTADAFMVERVVADGGKLEVKVVKDLKGLQAIVWSPKADGTLQPQAAALPSEVKAGQVLQVPVATPASLVSLGGFSGDKLHEGWVIAFPPASLQVKLQLPDRGMPHAEVPVTIEVRDPSGQPVEASVILEVYDNRVAAPNPAGQLGSALGDAVRRASGGLVSWVDPVELERQRREEERQRKEEERQERLQRAREEKEERQMMRKSKGGGSYGYGGMGAGGGGVAYGSGRAMAAPKMVVAGSPRVARANGTHAHADGDDDGGEAIVRLGEQKVTYVGLVRTDKDGRAEVRVPLPPQTGRVAVRAVAVRQLDWAQAESTLDVQRDAWVDARLPRQFVPGAQLDLHVAATNQGQQPLRLEARGPGLDGVVVREVPPGKHTWRIPWVGKVAGEVTLDLRAADGKLRDRRVLPVADLSTQAVTYTRLELGATRQVPLQSGDRVVVFNGPGRLMKGVVNNLVTSTHSWFPHAEAIAARVAIRATLLHAIHRKLLDDEGMSASLRADLQREVRDLHDRFFDPATAQIRPWPGLAPNPRWTALVARHLHSARRHLQAEAPLRGQLLESVKTLTTMTQAIDQGFRDRGETPKQVTGFDPSQDGLEVVPVEIDGQVVFRAVTDDVVQRFVIDQLAPALDPDAQDAELAMGKALDTFRYLRAFERTGRLLVLMESAKAAWLAGPKGRPAFDKLYATVARGLVLSQEPGVLQGPAMLGGVYSTPGALVRFLELTMLAAERRSDASKATVVVGGQAQDLPFGQRFEAKGAAVLKLPEGAVARVDRLGKVSLTEGPAAGWVKVQVSERDLAVGGRAQITLELDSSKDPLEFYALIAVPTTTAIRQTEDALSDYKGQLIYGQQSMGGGKMQVIAVPFRGSRTLRLWIEGLLPGSSDGLVVVRHVQRAEETCHLRTGSVRVRAEGPVQAVRAATR